MQARFLKPRPSPFYRAVLASSLAIIALPVGCGRDSSLDGRILHPNAENRPPADAALISRDSIPVGLSDQALGSWRKVRDALLGAQTTMAIGSNEPGPELFGYIAEARVGPDGHLVVFDGDYGGAQEVRVFGRDGAYVGGFGGEGDGPTELREASNFAFLPRGEIAVPLGMTGRVKVFGRTDDAWTLDEILETGVRITDICSLSDGRLFAASHDRRTNIIISELVDPPRGFGVGYQYHDSFVQRQMSSGLISCLENPERIAFAFDYLPMVRMYSAINGTLLWTARVDGYLQRQGSEGISSRGTTSFRRGRGDYDVAGSILGIGSGYLLVQYLRRDGWLRRIVPRTFLVDAETGHGAYLGDHLPFILSIQERSYVANFNDPYPRVEVRTFKLPSL